METMTYSLAVNNTNSEQYYAEIEKFTDELLEYAKRDLEREVAGYTNYLQKFNLEKIREKEEYLLELLSFGILWRSYAATAFSIRFAPYIMLSRMGEWRKKHQRIKPFIDFVRGICITLFLLPNSRNEKLASNPTLENIDRICKWFEATGEFREQALRFIRWRAYWGTLEPVRQEKIFSSITELVTWFEFRSNELLGKYTHNVPGFLHNAKEKYRWREDRISCMRTRSEYHLNMIGACLMNRAFRKEFLDTGGTAVLLPGCMRFRNNEKCEAIREPKGLKCAGCEPKCRVNHLRLSGLKENYEVYVIPHASDLSLWAPRKGEKKTGVIASACLTTLVEGGWELKRYGVPAQCVLLEYSGCKKHWHPEGIQTELNRKELGRILENRRN